MFSFVISLYFMFAHPFYVSVTEISHNSKEKTMEISCRMFYDDLERTLEKQYNVQLDILKPRDKAQLTKLLNAYITSHLVLTADGKKLELTFIGYEIQEDGAWSYFEAKGVHDVNTLKITDDLLFERHPEQINMIHVTVHGKRKSTKLENPDATVSFWF